VTLRNVPSFAYELDALVDTASFGPVRLDVAFGGNFYAIVDLDKLGIPFSPTEAPVRQRMLEAGLEIMDAVTAQLAPRHPEQPEIAGCHHVYLAAPDPVGPARLRQRTAPAAFPAGSTAMTSRHAMAIHPGWFDRSPCGTGTSARMAQLYARGELALGADFVNESIIGSRFVGRLVGTTTVDGRPAVLPTVTGRAWITGMGQYLLDPSDPFPAGFLL
jgi:proline racemase